MKGGPARLLLALTLLWGTGCALLEEEPEDSLLVCRSDADCASNEVCFVDGCGDPGQDIVVEVTPNPALGLYAQDFPVGRLRAEQNLELFDKASLRGTTLRSTVPPASSTTTSRPYSEPLVVRAVGTSALIPGVARYHEATLVPDNGQWTLPVASGQYAVTVLAEDLLVPPMTNLGTVFPGEALALEWLLPAADAVVPVQGQLTGHGGAPLDADLSVEALDAELKPISQRVPVNRGTGAFALALPPVAASASTVLLRVTARDAGALLPQQTFTVDPSVPLPGPLELGDFGAPVRVSGRVVALDGRPVVAATVSIQGRVGGGGSFQSAVATTDEEGRFELRSLPSATESPLELVVVPPAGSTSGLTTSAAVVPREDTVLPDVVCVNRRVARGRLLQPDNVSPAAGVRLVVEPVDVVPGRLLPPNLASETLTDANGEYVLRLDPALYRLDVVPGENLPRVSRFVSVLPANDGSEQAVTAFALQRGRTLRGRVLSSTREPGVPPGLPFTSIRFYRVVNVEGRPSSVLLAQSVTDTLGRYTALLPVR
ncbi:carboxypeptidase regulatory-like domain-containing protein [Myxococcus sp. CA051A]|uniref:carboxypeptidase-like regulatory domain-containing protein n=1 Tax=unclassified Myxococcus TaxID=2648731 RepID=UPI00157B739E|nr:MULTISPECIES: carboxypeptidase-like regulatory domain-containing protein [unclassified Myxococcus]NTX16584.1 carboxypeptidase regulatory-like domain-containing protein [Myxococcus sp. CA056]NTX63953.1 carboxypeptidase regulatory-like domain-containing protein [Myxococcus sp. CA051A]